MNTPGTVLKAERKKQKKSIEGIAHSLKLSIDYLKAIEDDDYNKIPAEIFVKAYIRFYAEALGLDSVSLINLYDRKDTVQPAESSEPSITGVKFSYQPLAIITALSLIFILTALLAGPVEEQEDRIITVTTVEEKEERVEDRIILPEAQEEKKSEQLFLKIEAAEITWVSVGIDGEKPKEWQMRQGDSLAFKAVDRFIIKVGNAGGTKLIYNGKDLGELGPHGKIVRIVLPVKGGK